ncbi:hypothetical protein L873DRAFT_1842950 [Choiromyces venosus 120613-1]|uniref:PiggyBac transposable element-derived protein domain-containing protein n=1 Tax=Choiromyces venosus 120613-1 TaxID=1336337 RepID=A0A3N4JWM2_9PEZI|nr:hypothetical protein L873DRAFT_1842950 [Choiromyces venosus 120613-1]
MVNLDDTRNIHDTTNLHHTTNCYNFTTFHHILNMDPYDSSEEEAVWILGQSVNGPESSTNTEPANHEEDEGGSQPTLEQETSLPNPSMSITTESRSAVSLPPVPPFTPYQYIYPAHSRRVVLPPSFPTSPEFYSSNQHTSYANIPSPKRYFSLFFMDETLSSLVQNTNLYAHGKGAGEQGRRPWKDITIAHLKIWLGIVIYMGVHSPKSGSMQNFWQRNDHRPVHQ